MESFVIIECEKLLIYALLVSHNHAQQTTLKPLYIIYIIDFCFLFEGVYIWN